MVEHHDQGAPAWLCNLELLIALAGLRAAPVDQSDENALVGDLEDMRLEEDSASRSAVDPLERNWRLDLALSRSLDADHADAMYVKQDQYSYFKSSSLTTLSWYWICDRGLGAPTGGHNANIAPPATRTPPARRTGAATTAAAVIAAPVAAWTSSDAPVAAVVKQPEPHTGDSGCRQRQLP